ncbi:hypothetical protein M23134_06510 [Microscilla marina ATCC 23134]|uniref:Uncharacterized protein n=1 Tax=Microscilla marina ATCC 23134 TaxID=313606 RepID=A1ZQP4_MICM2|nr:hypothetical protein M23134_06510 [Microscilla marina ATCC 23134]
MAMNKMLLNVKSKGNHLQAVYLYFGIYWQSTIPLYQVVD